MNLNTAQAIGLLISILGIAVLAIVTGMRKQAKGSGNSAPVVAGLIMGTLVGGSSTVGTAQLAYNYGLSAWWFTLGGGLACLVLALLFAGPWRHTGAMTLIAIISKEFGPRVGLTASLLSSVGTFINIISQLIAGTAVIAVVAPSLGLLPALLITAAFMALYVIGGGIRGAGMVGILKLALLYVSMICCGILALHLSGGFSGFTAMVQGIENPDGVHFGSLFARGLGKDGGACLSLILGVLTTQTYAQAVMSARTDRQARIGALVSAVMIPPIGAGGILVGLFMRAHFPGLAAKTALTAFATEYLPPLLSGVLLGTLFIAVVGTGAGLAMGISTIIRRDIIQRFSDRIADPRVNEVLSKLVILLVLGLGVVLSCGSLGDTILSFAFMSMGLRGAVVFIPMLCALWLPGRVNRNFAMAAVIAGPAAVLLFGTKLSLPGGIDPLFAGVAAAALLCVAGAVVGNRRKEIHVEHDLPKSGEVRVISVESELYAQGKALASALGERLGVPCYDEAILSTASELSHIPEQVLRRYDGKSVFAAYDLAAKDTSSMRLPTTGEMISAQSAACSELAKKGPCVLVDHFCSVGAKETPGVSVFVHADFETRADRLSKEKGIGPAAARRQLRRLDRARSRYYRIGNRKWGQAKAYTLTVDASSTEPEVLAEGIAQWLTGREAEKNRRAG